MTRRRTALVVLGTVIATLLTFAISDSANAQRPWRANMYNPYKNSQRSYRQPSYFGRVVEQPQSVQRFSVEPIDIHAGDMVKVTVETPLRLGQNVLADVPAGDTHKVLKVIGPWVGIAIEENGKEVRGWVTHRALEVQ
jgi:hypothetical protein